MSASAVHASVGSCSETFHSTADGLRLYRREYGAADAPAVLCLPGLTRNCRDFDTLARRLSARYRVIAPDLRGRGRSDHDPNWHNYQPQIYAADLLQLLATLAPGPVAVIGTSLGGLVGMLMAAAQPGLVRGLVLNDIGPEVAPEGVRRIQGYVGQQTPARDWEEAIAQTRQIYGAAYPDFDDAQWADFARLGYREDADGVPRADYDPEIRRAAQAVTAAPDLWPLFAALAPVPMLVLRGAHSDILAPATLQRMQESHPDLRSAVIPGRGHAPTLDEPESVTAIERFLAGLD
ncbi:alpha/beta fold hydrolase [Marilutibacter alkalisoli]|uniref:Alpha/beta hydrolase n=1 Tax=Marilutibacter alkalisoli TaxID=2591633 RepID=A0A514BMU0_9GAMM|nr:alpha/beta hydrolase [Lysobacter alkalisoli]QDH68708.1 alpha/beta hydrolase [Lysobacter alkalisoli]